MAESKLLTSKKILFICDDSTWINDFVSRTLLKCKKSNFTKVGSNIIVKEYYSQFKDAERIILHWEGRHRGGEGIIEELLEINKKFQIDDKTIILTTSPSHEDVLYFSELGLTKIVAMRNRQDFLQKAFKEFVTYFNFVKPVKGLEKAWKNIYVFLENIKKEKPEKETIEKIEISLEKILEFTGNPTCQYHDVEGTLFLFKEQPQKAIAAWEKAIEINSKYFRSYDNLIDHFLTIGEFQKAIEITKKLYAMNNKSISRMVTLGQIYESQGETIKAEHYYKLALSKDQNISGAINGLASIRFKQGDLEETRKLLTKSNLSNVMASSLNKEGILLVRKGEFEGALNHYSKAQYVLPMQDKGPMLFYNMGLCYSKWGRLEDAINFLKIALIKDPDYSKAKTLIEKIQKSLPSNAA